MTEFNEKLKLTNESIDRVSDMLGEFSAGLKLESSEALRMRLLAEELLLDWQERFSPEAEFRVLSGKRMLRPFICLELKGERFDPLSREADSYGSYRERIMAEMGLLPLYSYDNGVNRILFRPRVKKTRPISRLVLSLVLALATAFAGILLPEQMRLSLLDGLIRPVYDSFLRLLDCVAGPMIFISVACGICGFVDAATFGRIGKRMLLGFVGGIFLFCILGTVLAFFFFELEGSVFYGGPGLTETLLPMLLSFIPPDIASPFIEGNSMQLVVLATALGSGMLLLGRQTSLVRELLEQLNSVVLFIMRFIDALIPLFIFVVVVELIWSERLELTVYSWKPLLLLAFFILLAMALMLVHAGIKTGVSPLLLLRKLMPAALIMMFSSSITACFVKCSETCEKKLGINKSMCAFGIPLGIMMFPPGTALLFCYICISSAEVYSVACTPAWFIPLILMSCLMAIAAPPVAGGTISCYALLFTQLGIPHHAIAAALVLDILSDFIVPPFDIFCLQLKLLMQADKLGQLDREILRKKT